MKQELFKNIVDLYIKREKFDSLTSTDEYEIYVFRQNRIGTDEENYQRLKAEAVKRMKKGSCGYNDRHFNCYKDYISIKYDKIKDKISCSEFSYGYVYSRHKQRYVPIRRKTSRFCYSNKLYSFITVNKQSKVRIATPMNFPDMEIFNMVIGKDITSIGSESRYSTIPYNYFMDTKDGYDALSKYTGTPIPKALRVFKLHDLEILLRVLKDKNELNKLCQHIAKVKKDTKELADLLSYDDAFGGALWTFLADMMLGNKGLSWLVRDWVADHKMLKRKLSIKISSEKRLMDEHNRMSQEIRLRGIKEITVRPIYEKIMDDFPIKDAELIKDKQRLMQEGTEMEHCVASYANMINAGHCCILSIPYEGERWTAEIAVRNESDMEGNTKVAFLLKQLRGYRNKPAPAILSEIITRHLIKNSTDNRNELHKMFDLVELPF